MEAEKYSPAWVSDMLAKLKTLAAGQIWIDRKGNTVYVDSVQTKLKISPKAHHYVDFYDDFGLRWMDKKDFVQMYSPCGEAWIRRSELHSLKNLKGSIKNDK